MEIPQTCQIGKNLMGEKFEKVLKALAELVADYLPESSSSDGEPFSIGTDLLFGDDGLRRS